MDSVGEEAGAKVKREASENKQSRPVVLVSSFSDCNCDPKRRRGRRRRRKTKRPQRGDSVSQVSVARAGNFCPKSSSSSATLLFGGARLQATFCLFSLLLVLLIAAKQGNSQLQANQTATFKRQPEAPGPAAAPTKRPSISNGGGCLPLIGSLFGFGFGGGRCGQTSESGGAGLASSTAPEPQAETTTTTAAANTGAATMRYESLKVNRSAARPQWEAAGQQVSEAANSANNSSEAQQPRALISQPASDVNANASASASANSSANVNLNVLCNSRCNCVILDLSSQLARQQRDRQLPLVTPDTGKPSSVVAGGDSSGGGGGVRPSATPTGAEQSPSLQAAPPSSSEAIVAGSGSGADQANQALIAFNEDYSLDYEQPQLEQQQQQQPQKILSAAAGGSNPSNAQQQQQPQLAADQAKRHHQLQQQQPRESGQSSPSSSASSATPKAGAAAAAAAAANKTNNLQLFPLQHHHQAGSGGHASSAQLFAQSILSSQAPKLSYHAHSPYLKQSLSSSTLMGQTPANLNLLSAQNPQGGVASSPTSSAHLSRVAEAAPPVGSQPYHQQLYHAHNLRSSHAHLNSKYPHSSSQTRQLHPTDQQQHDQLDSADARHQFTRLQVQALIPLQKLNASSQQLGDRQLNLSSIILDPNSEVPESFLLKVEQLLARIELENVQSLILSHNDLEFELWTELYALLAAPCRQHIYHLDLSHNSIVKLGITFTGYLEHHLVVHGGIWSQPANSSAQQAATNTSQNEASARASSKSAQRTKTLFNGGKLYSLVQTRFRQSNSTQLLAQWTNSHQHDNHSSNSHKQLLSQPMLIRALDLSHNKLKWLINDQFKALKHVQTIRLDHNRIRYIHQHAFSGLESLRFLNLNYNRLQVIYIEQFQTNYNLLALMLRANYLAYLRGGSFASLSQLKRLDVSQNKLTILSNNAFIGLESLELLNCSSNQFVHVPSGSFHPLASLRKLDLSDNLISELAPGTFFHLPVEELWLNQNDQLVTIERGALWDLAYLSRLHLGSNPMLANVNSQSFVGTPNLQFIDTEDCPSLDSDARQLLENITITATLRQLRLDQQQQSFMSPSAAAAAATTTPISIIASLEPVVVNNLTNGNSGSITNATLTPLSAANSLVHADVRLDRGSILLPLNPQQQQQQQLSKIKYLYYVGTITLLIVALKLVFKYTSTSHYLESRRRRRRVYELDASTSSAFAGAATGSQQSASSGGTLERRRKYSSGSYSASHISSSPSSSAAPPDSDSIYVCDSGESVAGSSEAAEANQFELYESANNVIIRHQMATGSGGEQPEEQLEAAASLAEPRDHELDISVINVISASHSAGPPSVSLCCPDCDGASQQQRRQHPDAESGMQQSAAAAALISGGSTETLSSRAACCVEQQQAQSTDNEDANANENNDCQRPSPSIDLIHSQLIAAGFDLGHANCAHFYQSLGPALQLADIEANFVNNMDYY